MAPETATSKRADFAAILFTLVFPSLLTLVYFSILAESAAAAQLAAYGSLKVLQFGFPLYWFIFVQRRELRIRLTTTGLIPGLVFGVAVLVALWALYRLILLPNGWMDVAVQPIGDKIAGLGADTLTAYVAIAVFYSIVHSLLEEYYWRWFVFAQLRRMTGISPSILVSSVGFMAHHVILLGTFFGWTSPLAWGLASGVAVGGAVWAWMYERWDSLLPLWLGHLLVDAGIFWVGYDLMGGFS